MRLLTWKTAWLLDHGVNANIASSCAKLVGFEDAMRIATDALQVYGDRGYLENYSLAKLFRDAKFFQIYEGTFSNSKIGHLALRLRGILVDHEWNLNNFSG
jgi:acyl-CoA dehydrogenase